MAVVERGDRRMKDFGWILGAALMSGCTPRPVESDEHALSKPAHEPVATSEAEAATTEANGSAPQPAFRPQPEPTQTSAFVVYTEDHTYVLPVSADAPEQDATGLWVQDDVGPHAMIRRTHVLTRDGAEAMGMPECRCANTGCALGPTEAIDVSPAKGGAPNVPTFDCGCFDDGNHAMQPPDPEDFDGETFGPCRTQGDQRVTSLVGGVVYSRAWGWNGACFGGMSVYNAYEVMLDMVAEPRDIEQGRYKFKGQGCHYDLFPAEPTSVWPLGPLRKGTGDCESEYPESRIFTLRRGRLWRVEDTVGHAGGDRVVAAAPISPSRCPGVGDPCGRRESIAALSSVGQDVEFWVATDESTALLASRRQYAIHHASDEIAPVKRVLDVDATQDVIGVRYHEDARPLLEAIAASSVTFASIEGEVGEPRTCEPPALHWDDRGVVDRRGGRDWGDVCWKRVQSEEPESAIAACLRGLALEGVNPSVRAALHYNLGRAFELQERWVMAIREYDASNRLRPRGGVRARRDRVRAAMERG